MPTVGDLQDRSRALRLLERIATALERIADSLEVEQEEAEQE